MLEILPAKDVYSFGWTTDDENNRAVNSNGNEWWHYEWHRLRSAQFAS